MPGTTVDALAAELAMDPGDVALVAGWFGARTEADVDEVLCDQIRDYLDHLCVRQVPAFWWPAVHARRE